MLTHKSRTSCLWLAAVAAVALAGFALPTAPAEAREEVKVNIMISPEGSGPYNAFAVLQTRAKDNHPWLRPIAIETPGFNYNVSFMAKSPDKWKNTVFGSGSVVEWAAGNGLAPFYKKPLEEVKNYRIIGIMGVTGNVFVTFDDAIQNPNDFVGKNVPTSLLEVIKVQCRDIDGEDSVLMMEVDDVVRQHDDGGE